jgi:hypothetical protein
VFERPAARLEFTKIELRRLVTAPLWTVVTVMVSAVLGLALYSRWLNGPRFTETLLASGSLTATDVLGLVPVAPLTPVVVVLAVVIGLAALVSVRVGSRMEDRFGPDINRGIDYDDHDDF